MAIPRQFSGIAVGNAPYASALIQGTGVNPIHATRDSGGGRNIAVDGTTELVSPSLIEGQWGGPADFGYSYEDMGSSYSDAESPWETGTADRPSWGSDDPTLARQDVLPGYPSWSPQTGSGVAKGEAIRSEERGAIATNTPTAVPYFDGAAGWENKLTGVVIEPGSGISDPSQYTMQTSMQQLRRTRAGSQRGNDNSEGQSEYDAPIATRVPGMKLKVFGGQFRHNQMQPKQQTVTQRPFFNRQAGTGHPSWMQPVLDLRTPLDRTPITDPSQGVSTPDSGNGVDNYGYTSEDGAVY